MKLLPIVVGACSALFSVASALTISQINGHKYLSAYNGQHVTGVKGLVTAKGPSGFWIKSTTIDLDYRSSNSIYVFGSSTLKSVNVGDIITLDATVTEYRSSPAYLYLTELTSAANITVLSSGNKVNPTVIGEKLLKFPPTERFSSLDKGDVFRIPNNSSQISAKNPSLSPLLYGLDFWESLSGELVTVRKPLAISKASNYGDTWVHGSWRVSGKNGRGGLTATDRDANPEGILIGSPLDGSKNPNNVRIGDGLEEITGVVTQAFGFYRILPQTSLKIKKPVTPNLPPPTDLISKGDCSGVTIGSYNVENLSPKSAHLPNVASQIVQYLRTPDLLFIQEVQDDSGATDNNVVTANQTLTLLAASIFSQSGVAYEFADVVPVNNQDGGAPGGNIRNAYLYNPKIIRLRNVNPGGSNDANEVLPGPELKYNPGRIDPLNAEVWSASRKPIVAAWETLDGENKFFTVNVHFASKGGSSSIHGDARPPLNGVVEKRLLQANATANFIAQLLEEDPNARVIAAGDFNEFAFVEPLELFTKVSKLQNAYDVVKTPKNERYSYVFDMNCQQLDHTFVSKALTKKAEFGHVHISTWVTSAEQVSDHDPSVGRFDICA